MAIGLLACGGDDSGSDTPIGMSTIGPEGGTVASADGVAVLTIPPNALNAPVDITIDLLPQASWPASIAELEPVGTVYSIGPEGTTFATPATLTWSFDTAPAGARADNRPKILFGVSRSASDELESHQRTVSDVTDGNALTVTSQIAHLSEHLLTASRGRGAPSTQLGTVDIDLRGGDRIVDVPWDVPIVIHPTDLTLGVHIYGHKKAEEPVIPEPQAEWPTVPGAPPNSFGVYNQTLTVGEAYPLPPARYKCTETGTASATLEVEVEFDVAFGVTASGAVTTTVPVNCIEREQKSEYTMASTTLGDTRIADAEVPSSHTVDLTSGTAMGLYGYRIPIGPGQTIRVCVTANGSTDVMYYPRYSPGFNFVDGEPGCTDITNLDDNNPNEVLLELSGAASNVTIDISTIP